MLAGLVSGNTEAFVWSQDSGDTVAGVTADDQKKVYDQVRELASRLEMKTVD